MKFIANIWPIAVADGYTDTIIKELEKEGTILSIHKIELNYTGLRNYMIQIYRHEKWAGGFFNHFRGIPAKLNPCFHPDTPMYLIELEGSTVESMLTCKDRIRKLCKHEKHSLHTSDTHEEYLLMKKILLHPPTVALMNTVEFDRHTCFTRRFNRLLKTIEKNSLNYDDFLIVSRAAYTLAGISKEKKLSWIYQSKTPLPHKLELLNKKEFQPLQNEYAKDILDSKHHISYCGISFVHPDIIKKIEQASL